MVKLQNILLFFPMGETSKFYTMSKISSIFPGDKNHHSTILKNYFISPIAKTQIILSHFTLATKIIS